MSSLLDALTKTLQGNRPKTLRNRTNMIGKVISYDEDAKTIKVEAVNGPMAGEIMDIAVPAKGRLKITNFTRPSTNQTSSYTEAGGYLRFDAVIADGDKYACGWINAWIKKPGAEHRIVTEAQTQFLDTKGKTASGAPHYRLMKMAQDLERKVGSLEELQEALSDAFASHRGALLIDIDGETYSSKQMSLFGKKEDGKYVFPDAAAAAADAIGKLPQEQKEAFAEILAGRGMTVVPMASMPVGTVTAEEIEDALKKAGDTGTAARIMSINTLAYEVPSIGQRLDNALARTDRDGKLVIAKEHAERLSKAFLETAAEEAKAVFHKDGWKGVSDVDLSAFFASKDVVLKTHPADAWNRAAIHEQKFKGNSPDFFAAKTHESARYGNPYPALECTKELRAAYGNELVEAVQVVMAGPAVKAEAKSEAAAPAAKAEAPKAEVPKAEASADAPAEAKGEAEPAAASAVDAVDALLDDLL
ncbi:hypothetical protein ACEUZ9_000908 [Paracoccus litorisediminis]|uniref:hypothetical protein n=1 Tax=Paracoccus litorisediminis TaxID=2006130 RepID=UPI0037315551